MNLEIYKHVAINLYNLKIAADAIEPFMVASPFDILENNFQTDVDLLFGYVSAVSMPNNS